MSSYYPDMADRRGLEGIPREYWWKCDEATVYEEIFRAVEYLMETNQHEKTASLHYLRLYSNRMAMDLSGAAFAAGQDGGARIRMNVINSCVDAACAFISSVRARPMYLVEKGNWKKRQDAKGQAKFVSGVFQLAQQHRLGLDVFRDAGIWGTGWEQVYDQGGRIYIDRVIDNEIVLDQNDARYGNPRVLFKVRNMDRDVLKELYPDAKDAIPYARKLREEEETEYRGLSNRCTVVEAYHLPSGPDAKDGRRVVAVSSGTLYDEKEWSARRFNLAPWRWKTAPVGYRGVGIAEELAPIQVEINYIAQKIQKLMQLATSMVWTEKGSSVGNINNKDWAQREYRGKPPIFQTTASVSAEYFNHLDRLWQRAFEVVGISQLQAQSKKPAGLDSGEALRVYNDIGTKRFQHTGQRWELYNVVDVAERVLDVARQIQRDGGNPVKVLSASEQGVEEIDFSNVSLDEDSYITRVHPVSILPDTPAGKLQTFREIASITPALAEYVPYMMNDIPDLEHVVKRIKAPYEIAEKMVSNILENGTYEPPFPEMDLQTARIIATRELLNSALENVPEERMSLLRQYISDVDSLQAKAEAPPPGMGMDGVMQSAPGGPQAPQPQPSNPMAGTAPGTPGGMLPGM